MSGWKKVRIGEFLTERQERFKPDDKEIKKYQRLDKIDFRGTIHLSNKSTKTNMILVHPGDLVISGINVEKGAIAVYKGTESVTATIHYSSYTFNDSMVDLDYFKWFVKSSAFTETIKSQVKGGIKTEIKASTLLKLEITIPETIEEQKQIVKELASKIEKIESTAAEIEKQKTYIKQLRQSVLQDAVEGKLTVDWRKAHPVVKGDPDYDAEALFLKIQEEKTKQIKDGKKKADSGKPSVISDEEKPFVIPDGWRWVRLGEVIYAPPKNGYSPKAVNYETKTKSLKLGAITWAQFDESEIKYIDEEIPADSPYWLKKGDFLIQRSNSIDYVGICAIYTGNDNEFMYPDLMMKFRPSKLLNPSFVHKAIIAPFNRNYFREHAKGSQQTMPKINQKCVVKTLLPLPPIAEQAEIVRCIETHLVKLAQMEQQITDREALTKQLMSGILKDAFEEKEK
jgi:type I restriction enzyme S subunit